MDVVAGRARAPRRPPGGPAVSSRAARAAHGRGGLARRARHLRGGHRHRQRHLRDRAAHLGAASTPARDPRLRLVAVDDAGTRARLGRRRRRSATAASTPGSSSTASTSTPTPGAGAAAASCSTRSSRRARPQGIWTVQSGIFPENTASLALHERCGFRVVGRRERLGAPPRPLAGRALRRAAQQHRRQVRLRAPYVYRPDVSYVPIEAQRLFTSAATVRDRGRATRHDRHPGDRGEWRLSGLAPARTARRLARTEGQVVPARRYPRGHTGADPRGRACAEPAARTECGAGAAGIDP